MIFSVPSLALKLLSSYSPESEQEMWGMWTCTSYRLQSSRDVLPCFVYTETTRAITAGWELIHFNLRSEALPHGPFPKRLWETKQEGNKLEIRNGKTLQYMCFSNIGKTVLLKRAPIPCQPSWCGPGLEPTLLWWHCTCEEGQWIKSK